ncbi:MAG TPA: N-acetylmuramoyl-L-alanine amidase [Candidatus Methylomirabilis sp.]|nr:N-acetylmuramoyl-L-alanine amidase [Candidatus Methylomirabilis sp.]
MTMARAVAVVFLLLNALLGSVPGSAAAARPDAFELTGPGKTGSLGRLARVVVDDGAGYVSAPRLAALLNGSWSVKDPRGTLMVGKRAAQFVRNQRRIIVAGEPLTLDTAARSGASGWLIPEDFLTKGLPRLAPGVTAATAPVEVRMPAESPAKAEVALEDLRYRSYPSFTRIVLEAKGTFAWVVVPGREEIRVRLPRLTIDRVRSEEVADGLVKDIRLEPESDTGVLHVMLESKAGEVKTTSLQDPFRMVLDIYRPKESDGIQQGATAMPPLRLIVLDAGHGGHDPGATGPSGVMEKDVVLDVTRRAARLVEAGLGVKVALTRSTDVFIPLRERTSFASRQRADLFVSIHANAHPQADSEGVEVFFLSSEASDSQARHTAALENEAIQLESPASRQKSELLKSILWDLAQSEFQQESSVMAETVLDSMTRSLNLVPRGVKQAGFYVLGGAPMPAILIEIGFLTNRKEERKLATPEYREAVARAIYAGLAEYKRRYDQRVRTVRALPAR